MKARVLPAVFKGLSYTAVVAILGTIAGLLAGAGWYARHGTHFEPGQARDLLAEQMFEKLPHALAVILDERSDHLVSTLRDLIAAGHAERLLVADAFKQLWELGGPLTLHLAAVTLASPRVFLSALAFAALSGAFLGWLHRPRHAEMAAE